MTQLDETTPAANGSLPPGKLTPEEWLNTVYQGDHARQLSVRSIVTGMLLGGLMSISNLYVGIKTGWGLGVTITACVLAYAFHKTLESISPKVAKDPFTILENYTMSSAASAAGYMSSAGLVSAFPALYLTTGRVLTWWELMVWVACISTLGVFMAIPLKRRLINEEQLPFPTGIATAETLRSLHAEGEVSLAKARSLIWAAGLGALVKIAQEIPPYLDDLKIFAANVAKYALPTEFPLIPWAMGSWTERSRKWLDQLTIGFEGSTVMLAAGAIMGIRVGLTLLVGAILFYGVIGTQLIERGIVKPGGGYREIVSWTLWPATSLLVVSSVFSFAFRWRTILNSLLVLSPFARRAKTSREQDHLAAIEVPTSWFIIGILIPGSICVWMGHYCFQIRWDMGILAVLVTFFLSIVAARATGETDVTPIGAMGKITQLLYGVIAPSNMVTNIMTASITSGAASHSADLLTDLKTGYLLGGNPRKQTISQLFGVLAGTIVCVPVYILIVKLDQIGKNPSLPMPSAQVWKGVAELLAKGVHQLPRGALAAMILGGFAGALLACGEEFLPPKYKRWLPSATGLGIAGVIPAFNSISMALGAVIAWFIARFAPKTNERYTITVSSGLIAGESLMGVAFILLKEGPQLIRDLLHNAGLLH